MIEIMQKQLLNKNKVSFHKRLNLLYQKSVTHFDKFGVPETVTQRESIKLYQITSVATGKGFHLLGNW